MQLMHCELDKYMLTKTIEIIGATILFCIGLSITAWVITKFGNFVAVTLKIREKED
jgi:hypothetical protein